MRLQAYSRSYLDALGSSVTRVVLEVMDSLLGAFAVAQRLSNRDNRCSGRAVRVVEPVLGVVRHSRCAEGRAAVAGQEVGGARTRGMPLALLKTSSCPASSVRLLARLSSRLHVAHSRPSSSVQTVGHPFSGQGSFPLR